MLQFFIGIVIGGIVGFVVCAILVSGKTNKVSQTNLKQNSGEDNVSAK